MKLILTFTLIALSTAGLLAQDKKATAKPAAKQQRQKAVTTKDEPDSVYVPEEKKYILLNQATPEDRNFEMLRNIKMKPNTDLINIPGK
jgi:hypothetical protein